MATCTLVLQALLDYLWAHVLAPISSKGANGSTLAHLQLAENVWGPERKRLRWRNIHGDRQQLKLAQLASPNGTVWQVTEPAPNAAKQLKSLQIKPPPTILDAH